MRSSIYLWGFLASIPNVRRCGDPALQPGLMWRVLESLQCPGGAHPAASIIRVADNKTKYYDYGDEHQRILVKRRAASLRNSVLA